MIPTHVALTHYMFPITPVELHEGYIIGQERIITNRSGLFGWGDSSRHEVHVFDDQGAKGARFPGCHGGPRRPDIHGVAAARGLQRGDRAAVKPHLAAQRIVTPRYLTMMHKASMYLPADRRRRRAMVKDTCLAVLLVLGLWDCGGAAASSAAAAAGQPSLRASTGNC